MGSEGVSDSSASNEGESPYDDSSFSITYKQIFEQQCPMYMLYGMTYDQYWNGDCMLAKYYKKTYELKRRERNQELWLQGMYIYEAICDVAPILNANAKKGTKATPYADEPYPLTEKELKEYEERKARKEAEKQKANFEKMVASLNSNFERKENK